MTDNAPLLVMIHHNRPDLTRLAVSSLDRHTAPPHRLLVIDNASGDDLAFVGRERVAPNDAPRTFAANCNLGLAAGRGGPVVLLNNDLYFPPGWLEGLLRGLAGGYGVVGAISNFELPLSLPAEPGPLRLEAAADPHDLAPHWPRLEAVLGGFNASQRERPPIARPFVSFYAVAVSAAAADVLGGLDEGFVQGVEDADFCFRAWEAGHGVAQAPDAYVVHFSGASTQADPAELARRDARNLPVLMKKWPPARREALLEIWRAQGFGPEGLRLWARLERRAESLARRV